MTLVNHVQISTGSAGLRFPVRAAAGSLLVPWEESGAGCTTYCAELELQSQTSLTVRFAVVYSSNKNRILFLSCIQFPAFTAEENTSFCLWCIESKKQFESKPQNFNSSIYLFLSSSSVHNVWNSGFPDRSSYSNSIKLCWMFLALSLQMRAVWGRIC